MIRGWTRNTPVTDLPVSRLSRLAAWTALAAVAALAVLLPEASTRASVFALPAALFAWHRQAVGSALAVVAAVAVSAGFDVRLPAAAGPWGRTGQAILAMILVGGVVVATRRLRARLDQYRTAVETLERRAFHDRLTGLPNRLLLVDRLAVAIAHARRVSAKVAVLFLDLDGFKRVNDTRGHGVGDELLVAVGDRLRACVRASDTVARLGGDEFVVVLGEVGGGADAERVGAKIREALGGLADDSGGRYGPFSASIGISVFPDHGEEIDRLIAHADSAMYQSKLAGKDRCTVFSGRREDVSAEPWFRFLPEYVIGNAEIDDQHRTLMQLAEQFNTAIKAHRPGPEIARRFDELVEYTRFHFATEEGWMERHGYPGLSDHRRQHAGLIEEVGHIRERLAQGGELVVLQTIKDWLVGHIASSDRAMGRFLAQHPGRVVAVDRRAGAERS